VGILLFGCTVPKRALNFIFILNKNLNYCQFPDYCMIQLYFVVADGYGVMSNVADFTQSIIPGFFRLDQVLVVGGNALIN
jgi:hypothetical protein